MMSFLLALLLTGASPVPEGGAARPPLQEGTGDVLLREAKGLRYAQRWYEAAALYRRFLATQPRSTRVPEARFWLAATLESDQRWDEAAQAYSDFLAFHPDQMLLGREARLNRLRCWGMRLGQNPQATPGVLASLADPDTEVRVAASLQLAKTGDRRAIEGLKAGLELPSCADACSLALLNLGVRPGSAAKVRSGNGRYLVIRIREAGRSQPVTVRLALVLARAVVNYLSDAQIREARAKGVDLDSLTEQAASLPKGSVLLEVRDGQSSVEVTVE